MCNGGIPNEIDPEPVLTRLCRYRTKHGFYIIPCFGYVGSDKKSPMIIRIEGGGHRNARVPCISR